MAAKRLNLMQAARFPHYTAAELALDRTPHALAFLLATVGATWLLVASAQTGDTRQFIGLATYGAGLIGMFAASAASNSCGAYIQAQGRMRFHNVTWHGLVLLGAGLHWAAVADQLVNRRGAWMAQYARCRTMASRIVWRFPCSEACDGDA